MLVVMGCGSQERAEDGFPGSGAGGGSAGDDAGVVSPGVVSDGGPSWSPFTGPDAGSDAAKPPNPDASTGPSTVGDASPLPPSDSGSSADASADQSALADDATGPITSGDSGLGTLGPDASGLDVDSRAAYCSGSGPPVTVGDSVTGVPECTGAIAEWSFSHALCSCKDVNVQGYLKTDSFDSTTGMYVAGQGVFGAAVGVNGSFIVAGVPDIGGSLSVGSPMGLVLAGAAIVHGDMEVAGNLTFAGYSQVTRDLWVNGNVTSLGVLQVGRNLHEPVGGLTIGVVSVGGTTSNTPLVLPEPCACKPSEILDIGAIVTQGQTQNDDADIGLAPNALDAVVGAADITLPCGRFYLDQIGGLGAVTFEVPGRTALFVGGDIASAGVLDFNVGPAGELDVFVAGNLIPTGATTFGNVARPAAVRIYVAGSSDVVLTGAGQFVGNIYAPNANAILTGYSDVFGSIFAGDFEAPGAVFIHYDRGVLDAGNECPPPPPPVSSCDGGGDAPTRPPCLRLPTHRVRLPSTPRLPRRPTMHLLKGLTPLLLLFRKPRRRPHRPLLLRLPRRRLPRRVSSVASAAPGPRASTEAAGRARPTTIAARPSSATGRPASR